MSEIDVLIKVEDLELIPVYGSPLAAGADVRANLQEEVVIAPGASSLIPTGISLAIPEGYEIQVRPRSGLALRDQITVLNTPGTVDADYRGEVKVILINHGQKPFIVTPKMRIAQLVLAKVEKIRFVQETTLETTLRGGGGFGHTGVH